MRSQWSQELNLIQTIGALAEALATAESDLERAKDEKEVEKASEFQEQVHRLTTELKAQEKQLQSIHEKVLVNKEVTSEDIAAVVGEITGIPVARMMEGERAKLVGMEQRLVACYRASRGH